MDLLRLMVNILQSNYKAYCPRANNPCLINIILLSNCCCTSSKYYNVVNTIKSSTKD